MKKGSEKYADIPVCSTEPKKNDVSVNIKPANKSVCEKISVSWIFYDNLLDFRILLDFPGNHVALAAI